MKLASMKASMKPLAFSSSHINDNVSHSVTTAEALFTELIIEHNLPVAVADHANKLVKKMFPDSEIAKQYNVQAQKPQQFFMN